MMKFATQAWEWFLNRRFVAVLATVEGIAFAVLEFTDALPDGKAKGLIYGAAVTVTGLIQQTRVWAKDTVEALTGE